MCEIVSFPRDAFPDTLDEKHIFTLHTLCGHYNSVQILLLCQYTWLHRAEHSLVLVKRGRFGGEGQICLLMSQSSLHKQVFAEKQTCHCGKSTVDVYT